MIVMPLEQQIISVGRLEEKMYPQLFSQCSDCTHLVVIIIDLLTSYRTKDYSMHQKHEQKIHR